MNAPALTNFMGNKSGDGEKTLYNLAPFFNNRKYTDLTHLGSS